MMSARVVTLGLKVIDNIAETVLYYIIPSVATAA